MPVGTPSSSRCRFASTKVRAADSKVKIFGVRGLTLTQPLVYGLAHNEDDPFNQVYMTMSGRALTDVEN
jgi:hypothetical protein